MKHVFYIVFAFSTLATLSGCENMGFNEHAINEALTPNVDTETTAVTWETDGNGNVKKEEKEIQNPPGFQ